MGGYVFVSADWHRLRTLDVYKWDFLRRSMQRSRSTGIGGGIGRNYQSGRYSIEFCSVFKACRQSHLLDLEPVDSQISLDIDPNHGAHSAEFSRVSKKGDSRTGKAKWVERQRRLWKDGTFIRLKHLLINQTARKKRVSQPRALWLRRRPSSGALALSNDFRTKTDGRRILQELNSSDELG